MIILIARAWVNIALNTPKHGSVHILFSPWNSGHELSSNIGTNLSIFFPHPLTYHLNLVFTFEVQHTYSLIIGIGFYSKCSINMRWLSFIMSQLVLHLTSHACTNIFPCIALVVWNNNGLPPTNLLNLPFHLNGLQWPHSRKHFLQVTHLLQYLQVT